MRLAVLGHSMIHIRQQNFFREVSALGHEVLLFTPGEWSEQRGVSSQDPGFTIHALSAVGPDNPNPYSFTLMHLKEMLRGFAPDNRRHVTVAAATLTSGLHSARGADHPALNPYRAEEAAPQAYEMAGLGPEDIDIIQVHDAATIGEIQHLEGLGIVEKGEGWVACREGRTEISGDIPTNTDGGLLAMGHPFGASGIRMIHEIVTQLRGEAGRRQVSDPRVGLAHCSGAGDITNIHIFTK